MSVYIFSRDRYVSNIDLSGDFPLPQGVTNLCDEPIIQVFDQNATSRPSALSHQVPSDALISKQHIVDDKLNLGLI